MLAAKIYHVFLSTIDEFRNEIFEELIPDTRKNILTISRESNEGHILTQKKCASNDIGMHIWHGIQNANYRKHSVPQQRLEDCSPN